MDPDEVAYDELSHLDQSCLPIFNCFHFRCLTLLHSERPKLYAVLAFLSAIGLKCKCLHFNITM